jgi:archaellum biogenesis ATPase FlaH
MYSTNKHRHQQYPDTDENPTNEIRPQIVSRRLSEVEPEELDWLWLERVPLGKLTLLAGDPGLGKSFLTLDMAARVSRGEPWPDDPATLQPVGSVILFSAEDDLADTIRPRLDKADADVSRIMAVEGVQWSDAEHDESGVRHFSLENDLPRLEELITENPGTRLVVIDPISAFCGRTDSHKNSEVRALLSPLAQLASKHSVAVVADRFNQENIGRLNSIFRKSDFVQLAWEITERDSRNIVFHTGGHASSESKTACYNDTSPESDIRSEHRMGLSMARWSRACRTIVKDQTRKRLRR